ncbi:MAG: potassium channel family protein, partial [Myxococcota bacterium]
RLYFLTPFMARTMITSVIFGALLFGTILTVILAIWSARLPRFLGLAFAVVAVVNGVFGNIKGFPQETVVTNLIITCFSYSGFILVAIVSIGKDIFVKNQITMNVILGSLCIYMFIGMFFAFLFAGLGLSIPSSIHIYDTFEPARPEALADFMYFSFSSLTTIGYGDILATHPFTKLLAAFEGVIGTLYVAVMIARLVGMTTALKNEE